MRSFLASLLLLAVAAPAQPSTSQRGVGDAYEITLTRDSVTHGTDGALSSSHDQDTVIERVIRNRGDGVELEYDLPPDASKEEKASTWQFPVRVFRALTGQVQLLDRPELERRIDAWLKAAELPKSACGRLVFTWNAFRIECDPNAVMKTIEAFDLPTDVHEGTSYHDPNGRIPAVLMRSPRPDGAGFSGKTVIDPDVVRRARAETDVGVGEIMNRPVTLEAALAKHANETISGTISVNFDTDAAGRVWRKRTVTVVETKENDGRSETQTTTATLERHRLTD